MAVLGDTTITTLSVLNTISENGTALSNKYVPTTRTINGKALSSNVTLYGTDIKADDNPASITLNGWIQNVQNSIPTIPSNNVTGSGTSGYIAKFNGTNTITNGPAFGSSTTTYLRNDGSWDTPNTAGSTDTSSKIFLVGTKSQTTSAQTYSQDTAYVGTDGCLYSGGAKVLTSHQSLSGYVPTSTKINNVSLTNDVNLTALDINMDGTTASITISGAYDVLSNNKQDKITSTNKLAASLISGLATVATSGSYNDLSDKPTIPSGITGAGVYFGVCSTAAATVAKTVTLSRGEGFALTTGVTVFIKFTAANTASNPTLNVNGTGAKALMQYGTTAISTNSQSTGWRANAIVALTYDGTNWIRTHWENSVIYYTSIYCTTSASTAAKVGAISSGGYQLTAGKNFQVMMYYSNTKAAALTLNIASTGAKPIYINGKASSSTNYTLPAGEYLVYYDGTNYYFDTDGTFRAKKIIADNSPMLLTLSGDGDVITGDDFTNYYTNPNPAHVIYHSGQRQYYYLQMTSSGTDYNVYYVCPSSSGSHATRDTIEITPTGYWSLWA